MALHRRILHSSFWNGLSTACTRGSLFLSAYITANLLGAKENGTWSLLQSTFLFFAAILSFGLPIAVTKYIAEWRKGDPTVASKVLAFSHRLIAWGSIILGAIFMGGHSIWWPNLSVPTWVMVVTWLVVYLSVDITVMQAAFNGEEQYRRMLFTNVIQGSSLLLFQVLGAYVYGVFGMLTGLCCAQAIGFIQLRRMEPITTTDSLSREQKQSILRMALPIVGIGMAHSGLTVMLNNHMITAEPGALGAWHAFSKVLNVLLVGVGMLLAPLMPILSNTHLPPERMRHLLQVLHLAIWFLAVLPMWLVSHLAPAWLPLAFSASYAPFTELFIVAGLFTSVGLISLPSACLAQAKGLVWPTLAVYCVAWIVLLLFPSALTGSTARMCHIFVFTAIGSTALGAYVSWQHGFLPSHSFFFSTATATLGLFWLPPWLAVFLLTGFSIYWYHYRTFPIKRMLSWLRNHNKPLP